MKLNNQISSPPKKIAKEVLPGVQRVASSKYEAAISK